MTWWPLRPSSVLWLGFTEEQASVLDLIDLVGHNGWNRNGQIEYLMPQLLAHALGVGLTVDRVKEAMRTVGYDPDALDMLDRWESKRTTGSFGR